MKLWNKVWKYKSVIKIKYRRVQIENSYNFQTTNVKVTHKSPNYLVKVWVQARAAEKIWTIIISTEHCSQRPLDVIGGDNDEEDEEDLHLGAIGAEGDATEKTLSGMGGQ